MQSRRTMLLHLHRHQCFDDDGDKLDADHVYLDHAGGRSVSDTPSHSVALGLHGIRCGADQMPVSAKLDSGWRRAYGDRHLPDCVWLQPTHFDELRRFLHRTTITGGAGGAAARRGQNGRERPPRVSANARRSRYEFHPASAGSGRSKLHDSQHRTGTPTRHSAAGGVSARDITAWHGMRAAATRVRAADDRGSGRRCVRLSASDCAAWHGMRSSARLRAADGAWSDWWSVRVPAGNGATGPEVRSADGVPSAADRESRRYGVHLPGRNGAARQGMRAASGLQSAGETQSPWCLRMSAGYGGERKQLYRAGAPVTSHHARRYHASHPRRRRT